MHIRTLLLNPEFPACLRCGRHLTRKPISNVLLRRLAHIARVFPFACEGCHHRIMAFTWPGQYVEWDGHILVMPDRDSPLRIFHGEFREYFFFYVFLVALGILVVWSVIQSGDLALRPPETTATP